MKKQASQNSSRIRLKDILGSIKNPKVLAAWKQHPLVVLHGCTPTKAQSIVQCTHNARARETTGRSLKDPVRWLEVMAIHQFFNDDYAGFSETIEDLKANGWKKSPRQLADQLKNYGSKSAVMKEIIIGWLINNWTSGRMACTASNSRAIADLIEKDGISFEGIKQTGEECVRKRLSELKLISVSPRKKESSFSQSGKKTSGRGRV